MQGKLAGHRGGHRDSAGSGPGSEGEAAADCGAESEVPGKGGGDRPDPADGRSLSNPKLEKKIGQFKMFFATNVLNKNGSILEKLQKNHQVVSLEVQTQAPVLLRD